MEAPTQWITKTGKNNSECQKFDYYKKQLDFVCPSAYLRAQKGAKSAKLMEYFEKLWKKQKYSMKQEEPNGDQYKVERLL